MDNGIVNEERKDYYFRIKKEFWNVVIYIKSC